MSTRQHFGIGSYVDTSRTGSNTTTTPAANAVLASISSVPKGNYKAEILIVVSGTAEVVTLNVKLNRATDGDVITLPSAPGSYRFIVDSFSLSAAQNVRLQAVALATTGAVYSTALSITRIG